MGEYNHYLEMRHRMVEKNNLFSNKCISCGRYTHNVMNCPRIHLVKKDGYKIMQQKIQLRRYRCEQLKKVGRVPLKYNWKETFGSKELEKEANLLTNNENDIGNDTIENYLKKLAFRDSVNVVEKKRASVVMVFPPKDFIMEGQPLRETAKLMENGDRSMLSCDSD